MYPNHLHLPNKVAHDEPNGRIHRGVRHLEQRVMLRVNLAQASSSVPSVGWLLNLPVYVVWQCREIFIEVEILSRLLARLEGMTDGRHTVLVRFT